MLSKQEWKSYVAYRKEERMYEARRIADRKLAGLNTDSDDSDDEERDRQQKGACAFRLAPTRTARFFAPPSSYNDDAGPSIPQAAPPAQTADEAYARRVAMSQQLATGDEAYARRAAMSFGESASDAPSSSLPPTGTPSFVRSGAPTPATASRFLSSTRPPLSTPTGPSEFELASTPTGLGPSQMAMPEFRPIEPNLDDLVPDEERSPVASTSTAPPPSINLSEAQARARAIAEKLAKFAGKAPQPAPPQVPPPPQFVLPPPPEKIELPPTPFVPLTPQEMQNAGIAYERPDPHGFAKRLMEKYGHTKGKGLGANESGMIKPLSIEQQKGKARPPSEGGSSAAPTGFGSGRTNVIIDERKGQREATDRARYGEPSRTVLLRNVCGRGQVDEDLPAEIAEEASKHGYVERVFVHEMPPNASDEEAIRVFVIFSGPAGAYEAVRAFDGRFFGGRTVRATYFDEAWAQRKIWGMTV